MQYVGYRQILLHVSILTKEFDFKNTAQTVTK